VCFIFILFTGKRKEDKVCVCVLNIEIKRGLWWELGPGVEMIAFLFSFIGDSSNTHTHVQTHTHSNKFFLESSNISFSSSSDPVIF